MTPTQRSSQVPNRPILAITGATGFIGQAVLRAAFADGWQPRVLVRRYPRHCLQAGHCLDLVLGDLDDGVALAALVRQATAIVHLAGLIKALHTSDFFAANADGTERLLNAAAATNPAAALVHVSSLAAREPQLSPYAASKFAGEERVRQLAGARPWVIIRPPAVYGPGDPATLPLFRAASVGILPYPATAGAQVSLIHVDDLARAIVNVAKKLSTGDGQAGGCAEIDDGKAGGYNWAEIADALAGATGHRVRRLRLPRALLWPIAAATTCWSRATGRAEVLCLDKVAELYHPDWVAGGAGLPAAYGWRPEIELKSGFSETCDWYRNHSFIR
jgi:nucleoside-diphosphate-sugar epimerase